MLSTHKGFLSVTRCLPACSVGFAKRSDVQGALGGGDLGGTGRFSVKGRLGIAHCEVYERFTSATQYYRFPFDNVACKLYLDISQKEKKRGAALLQAA